jgi:hypothetical protein
MARTTQSDVADIDVAEEVFAVTPAQAAHIDAQRAEYGTYRAAAPIYVGVALAYNPGDPVPVSNVLAHGYEAAGLVEKVSN